MAPSFELNCMVQSLAPAEVRKGCDDMTLVDPHGSQTGRKRYDSVNPHPVNFGNFGDNILNPHSKMAGKLPKQGVKYKQSRGHLFHSGLKT